mmetsp:Transcript_19797/g.19907  ORF Transcript_19797/g.19907 Transcript_19797/m.19907 type:complete len:317 (-) Transcript_19797:112-1062(-)
MHAAITEFDDAESFLTQYLRNNTQTTAKLPRKSIRCFPACSHKNVVHFKHGYCGRPMNMTFSTILFDHRDTELQNVIFLGEFVPTVSNERTNMTDRQAYDLNSISSLCCTKNKNYTFLGILQYSAIALHENGLRVLTMKVSFNNDNRSYSYDWAGSRWGKEKHTFRVTILYPTSTGYQRIGTCSSPEFSLLSSRRNKCVGFNQNKETRCNTCNRLRSCLTDSNQCVCGHLIFPRSYAQAILLSIPNLKTDTISTNYVHILYEIHKAYMTTTKYITNETTIPFIDNDWIPSFLSNEEMKALESYEWNVDDEEVHMDT